MTENKKFIIISTLGPACLNQRFLETAARLGQPFLRINTAHLTPEKMQADIDYVRGILGGNNVQFYADLPGKKLRIGRLKKNLLLQDGRKIRLIFAAETGSGTIPISHDELFQYFRKDDILLLQDGQIRLRIMENQKDSAQALVLQGGILKSRAGLIIRNRDLPDYPMMRQFSEHLKVMLSAGIQNIALSYVTKPDNLGALRNMCNELNYPAQIIAKIEHPMALANLTAILKVSDQVWYCRGDLGSFIDGWELGKWQDETIVRGQELERPVFIAGQVFYHLVNHPLPTRSEMVHFYHLQNQGVRGIVLSDETAVGTHPGLALEQVSRLLIPA